MINLWMLLVVIGFVAVHVPGVWMQHGVFPSASTAEVKNWAYTALREQWTEGKTPSLFLAIPLFLLNAAWES